jgi:hypothetical protein
VRDTILRAVQPSGGCVSSCIDHLGGALGFFTWCRTLKRCQYFIVWDIAEITVAKRNRNIQFLARIAVRIEYTNTISSDDGGLKSGPQFPFNFLTARVAAAVYLPFATKLRFPVQNSPIIQDISSG